MREGGFEPPRPFGHWHLKPARLPFRHSRKKRGTGYPTPDGPPNRPDAGRAARPERRPAGTIGRTGPAVVDAAPTTVDREEALTMNGLQRFEQKLEQ